MDKLWRNAYEQMGKNADCTDPDGGAVPWRGIGGGTGRPDAAFGGEGDSGGA